MYGFVDTLATEDAKSISMSIQTIFNGINLDEELTDDQGSFTTLTVSGRREQKQKISTIPVPGLDGVIEEQEPTIEPLEPEVKFRLRDDTNEGFGERLIRLRSLLSGSKKKLKFTDEEVFLHATVDFLEVPEEESNDLICYIRFFCSDPYLYGPEQPYELEGISVVENKGTAEADPIFELTAKKKSTFAMVSNGDDENTEYNLIGTPADVDEKIVDEKITLFDETGDTLSAWDIPVSSSKGSFKAESNGIFVDSYGTGEGWHGPALLREIDPINDFEIEFFVRVRTESARQTFRLSTNFYDENNDDLGMMRLWNKSTNQINKVVEARIGPYVGQFENYLISSRNYNWIGQRVYNGIIRVTRKGNVYTFYAAHITQRGNHIESITERYVDSTNEYAGKLKYIQIDASIYGDTPSPNALSIPRVRVTQHNQVLVDETPYILYPGDIVTLDHKDDDILVNGEQRSDLKNFGGSFFKLKKGENRIIVTPEDTFDSKVTFRDKYS